MVEPVEPVISPFAPAVSSEIRAVLLLLSLSLRPFMYTLRTASHHAPPCVTIRDVHPDDTYIPVSPLYIHFDHVSPMIWLEAGRINTPEAVSSCLSTLPKFCRAPSFLPTFRPDMCPQFKLPGAQRESSLVTRGQHARARKLSRRRMRKQLYESSKTAFCAWPHELYVRHRHAG